MSDNKPAPADADKSGSKVQGEGDYESARKFRQDTERFLKGADVEDLAHRAAPKSKEEAADLKKAEEIGRSHRADARPATDSRGK